MVKGSAAARVPCVDGTPAGLREVLLLLVNGFVFTVFSTP